METSGVVFLDHEKRSFRAGRLFAGAAGGLGGAAEVSFGLVFFEAHYLTPLKILIFKEYKNMETGRMPVRRLCGFFQFAFV